MIIPRGRISHTLYQSMKYVFMSLVSNLNNKNKILRFEKSFASYIGSKHCIAFPHARTAIYFILKKLNLPQGSKIIMPALTIKFILDVVVSLGLEPQYLDYDLETYSFDLEELDKLDDPNIKVMLLTPIFGIVPNMHKIKEYCDKNDIFLIEDFSQCLNGRFGDKNIGSFGNASVYSASSIKTLDTLGGGFMVTDNDEIYLDLKKQFDSLKPPNRYLLFLRALLNFARNFATHLIPFNFITRHFIKIISKRNSENTLRQTGTRDKTRLNELPSDWFYSYSSLQAEIALENINDVKRKDSLRRECADHYIRTIGKKYFAQGCERSFNVYWQLPIKTSDSMKFHKALWSKGVDSALTSLQLISSLENYPGHTKLKNAEKIFNNGLFIPCYSQLKSKECTKVSDACIKTLEDELKDTYEL